MDQAQAKMPSAAGYWIAAALIIIGLAVGIALIVSGVGDVMAIGDKLPKPLEVPGKHTVALPAGEHTIFEEAHGRPGTFESYYQLEIYDPAGQAVTLESYRGEANYSAGDRSGEAIYSFSAPQAGDYIVESSASQPDALDGGVTTIVITDISPMKLIGSVMGKVFGGVGVMVVCGLLALVLFIVTIVRRSGAKKRLAPTYPQAPPPAQQ
jgi:hypothetical protein